MSHSTLLVIVENAKDAQDAETQAEEMLEAFDENIEVEPYVDGVVSFEDFKRAVYDGHDVSDEEARARFENPTEADATLLLNKLWLSDVRIVDGEYVNFSTYNQNSRWDWYQLGGRWQGMLPVKGQEEGVDVIQKKNLDIAGGREQAIKEANEIYDKFEELKSGRDAGPSFKDILDSLDPELAEEKRYAIARERYNSNPVVVELQKQFGLYFTSPHDYFKIGQGGRYTFVEAAAREFIATHAVLTAEGDWLEVGQMLMFGVTADPMEGKEWSRIFWDQIEDAPEDAWFLVYDLHI